MNPRKMPMKNFFITNKTHMWEEKQNNNSEKRSRNQIGQKFYKKLPIKKFDENSSKSPRKKKQKKNKETNFLKQKKKKSGQCSNKNNKKKHFPLHRLLNTNFLFVYLLKQVQYMILIYKKIGKYKGITNVTHYA